MEDCGKCDNEEPESINDFVIFELRFFHSSRELSKFDSEDFRDKNEVY